MASNHALRLGKLLGNLQSLEALLRIYLLKVGPGAIPKSSPKKPYWDLVVGETVDEDEFSNYDTLNKLIVKFNQDIASKNPQLSVDTHVVVIRDLLAHGRVASTIKDTSEMKILKFNKPQDGKAVVSANILMDDLWFDKNIALVREQIEKVAKVI